MDTVFTSDMFYIQTQTDYDWLLVVNSVVMDLIKEGSFLFRLGSCEVEFPFLM